MADMRPPLKKPLFPVQRVTIIEASREAAIFFKSFFLPSFFLCVEIIWKMLGGGGK